ncbi:Asp23/Gls24 family envelope stress response protein [Kineococcus rhizosphaerae]|uniref:Putative alkaline shock family protein YloU n=1 Tax=Kineococcus rhizosphaerae TaxID=559628 RepID=A0A2T0R3I7_9ACTN|nr:Asp23/Gls24 family envelope stress response protein [Kineococcus rhizosphaerae]PRY14570.1 putative alkaline shock family protein YloU [Kineococcus rhizosphaerae]
MADTTATTTRPTAAGTGTPGLGNGLGNASRTGTGNGLGSDHGSTTIADTVVSKIAGIAAGDVSGVHALGGGAARAVGALRERIPGGRVNRAQGVSVEVGERQAAIDIELIAEYGVPIADLTAAVRRNVIASVERMTGLEVTEVNLEVSDIHLPEDDEDTEKPTARVQ